MFEKASAAFKDWFGGDNEFVQATNAALEERISSPFYGYFIVGWIITNWKLVYASFFLDQDKIFQKTGLLRNEYIQTIFPVDQWFWLNFFIIPIAFTLVFFWISPYWTRPIFRKSIRNKKALKVIELQESQEVRREQKELIKEETALIQEEIVKAKEEKKAEVETPEIIWNRDFENFKNSKFFFLFKKILDAIYEHGGKTKAKWNRVSGYYEFSIDTDTLIYSDTNGLINMLADDNISLTEKGRYFAQKYYANK